MKAEGPRIVVLGGAGMLGHRMFLTLREAFEGVLCTLRGPARAAVLGDGVVEGWDLARLDEVERRLRALGPDWVVNCAGVIKQRDPGRDPLAALAINAFLPQRLAEACADWGGRLLHFSTDCVFRGSRGRYTENDLPDADDLYGRSKALGEAEGPGVLTLRTSMIGRELSGRRSLLEWFLAQDGRTVPGYTNAVFSGLTTLNLARLAAELLSRPVPPEGLYHVAGDPISKYELLLLLREAYGRRIEIVPDDSVHCDRSLDDSRFRAATGLARPSWPDLVRELAQDPTPYSEWRTTAAWHTAAANPA